MPTINFLISVLFSEQANSPYQGFLNDMNDIELSMDSFNTINDREFLLKQFNTSKTPQPIDKKVIKI